MRCTIIISVILLCLLILPTKGQEIKKFYGQIECSRDTILIEDVHIINLSKKRGTTSNKEGLFRISAAESDSILFSVLGYEFEMVIIDSAHLVKDSIYQIVLNPKTYSIPDIFVWPYLTYAEFKQAFIHFDKDIPEVNLKLPREEIKRAAAEANPHISLGSPITALYMQFSKEGKELRKYWETLERDNYEIYLASKYNEKIVQKITGLKTIEEVRTFMDYCDFADDFIARSSEYTIYAAILNCYENYKTQEISN